jgi:hypothetical protein
MKFNDSLPKSQLNTGGFRTRIKLVEKAENPVNELWVDPDSLITDKEDGQNDIQESRGDFTTFYPKSGRNA